jgi:hypothetical protein
MIISLRRLERGAIDHELIWSSIALVSLAGLWIYARLPGAEPLTCPFHAITGWPCVTCGGTRATLALLRGAVAEAFRWNPLVALAGLAAVPYLAYAVTAVVFSLPRVHVTLDARDWLRLRVSTLLAVAATWTFLIVDGR